VLARALIAVVVVAFVAHLQTIRAHAVDLPYQDEWALLAPDALPRGLTLEWLLARHNEHRIPLTKLHAWLSLQVDGWNNVGYVTTSFLLYGALLLALGRWLVARGLPVPAAALFTLPLLSPIAFQDHAWGFQSQVHLALLGLVLGCRGLFERGAWTLGAAGLCLAAFSFAAGVAYAVAVLLAFALSRPEPRREALLVLAAVGLAVSLWAVGWDQAGELSPTWPTAWRFWDTLLNLVSLGFGVETPSWPLGLACLLAVAAPAAVLAARERSFEVAGATLALLLGLAAIALARGAWGPVYAKTSRYAELALPLLPVAALGWWRALRGRPRARRAALAALWAAAWLGLADDWNADGYRAIERQKRETLARLATWTGGPLRWPDVYLGPRDARVEAARALGLSFTR
jgi:hypothetical protein